MRKIGALIMAVVFILPGCATFDNQKFGNKFFSEEIVWKEFSANIRVWLKDGINLLKSDDLISKFGGPVTTIQFLEGVALEWEYREIYKKEIDYIIGQSQSSIENMYVLMAVFNDADKLSNFSISQTNRDGKGQIWTSKQIIEMTGAAAFIYIGGRWMGRTIDRAGIKGREAAA